jgi:hypothetical protein
METARSADSTERQPYPDARVANFILLFRGRADAYGSWDGGCVRKPLSGESFARHLTGIEPIGVYPLVPFRGGWGCVWGCSDIDVDDYDAACNLQMAFSVKGIKAWVEKTRKGYHVWVFATELVPAATMRRAFLAAHQAIGLVAKEVNPKQETVGNGFGNYVRLPYNNQITDIGENRYVVVGDLQTPVPFADFVTEAIESRTRPEQLEEIASLWREPKRETINIGDTLPEVKLLLKMLSPLAYTIWKDGPYQGGDRSSTLVKLCHHLYSSGLNPTEAYSVIKDADRRWGKYYDRADGEEQMLKIVSKVYGEAR